jgi:NDP-sugar pyrophosphorylase family protein
VTAKTPGGVGAAKASGGVGAAITAGGVIAAGRGSRLKGLGVPKPMVEVGGVPLIEHVLENFQAAGVVSAAVIFNAAEEGSSLESFREILDGAPKGRLLVSTVDAYCPRPDFVRFAEEAARTSTDTTVLAVTGFVDDEKPLWVTTTRKGRVTVVGGSSGDGVTAGIYVIPERVRRMRIPDSLSLPRLRDFLAWLCKSGEPMQAIAVGKVVDVDRAEDLESAEELARAAAGPGGRA